ncbi:hypothetical protein SFUMM280S_05643 [Streptomyces fumanus]
MQRHAAARRAQGAAQVGEVGRDRLRGALRLPFDVPGAAAQAAQQLAHRRERRSGLGGDLVESASVFRQDHHACGSFQYGLVQLGGDPAAFGGNCQGGLAYGVGEGVLLARHHPQPAPAYAEAGAPQREQYRAGGAQQQERGPADRHRPLVGKCQDLVDDGRHGHRGDQIHRGGQDRAARARGAAAVGGDRVHRQGLGHQGARQQAHPVRRQQVGGAGGGHQPGGPGHSPQCGPGRAAAPQQGQGVRREHRRVHRRAGRVAGQRPLHDGGEHQIQRNHHGGEHQAGVHQALFAPEVPLPGGPVRRHRSGAVRQRGGHPPAAVGHRLRGQPAADGRRPLPHARDAVARPQAGGRRGPAAPGAWRVVVHGQVQSAAGTPDPHPHGCAGGIPQRIGQGLADDAVGGLGRRAREVAGQVGVDGPAQQAEPGDQFLQAPAHRLRTGRLRVPQDGGQPAQRGERLLAGARGERQGFGDEFGPCAAQPAGRVDGDDHRGQMVGADVVQFPGEAVPFGVGGLPPLLLGPRQPPGRRPPPAQPLPTCLAQPRARHVQRGRDAQVGQQRRRGAAAQGARQPRTRDGGADGVRRDPAAAAQRHGVQRDERAQVDEGLGARGVADHRAGHRPGQRSQRGAATVSQRDQLQRDGRHRARAQQRSGRITARLRQQGDDHQVGEREDGREQPVP